MKFKIVYNLIMRQGENFSNIVEHDNPTMTRESVLEWVKTQNEISALQNREFRAKENWSVIFPE